MAYCTGNAAIRSAKFSLPCEYYSTDGYMFSELADLHLICGYANDNDLRAADEDFLSTSCKCVLSVLNSERNNLRVLIYVNSFPCFDSWSSSSKFLARFRFSLYI